MSILSLQTPALWISFRLGDLRVKQTPQAPTPQVTSPKSTQAQKLIRHGGPRLRRAEFCAGEKVWGIPY